jgi:hypothetical protein
MSPRAFCFVSLWLAVVLNLFASVLVCWNVYGSSARVKQLVHLELNFFAWQYIDKPII